MAGARIARRRRNPIANDDHLPYDEWIPSHAVKFNSDGTVDLMTEGQHNPRRNAGDRPEIHVYGEGNNWTYSMILPYRGHGSHYSHHFDKSFSSPEAALRHAEEHIGKPGYGGEFGTVENWDDPEIYIHYEGWEPAGIYALGPGSGAHHVANAGMVQNIQGYKDAAGHFHPIRWDSDYDPEEWGIDEPHDYVISPSRKFYSMSGETPPRSRRRKRR